MWVKLNVSKNFVERIKLVKKKVLSITAQNMRPDSSILHTYTEPHVCVQYVSFFYLLLHPVFKKIKCSLNVSKCV